MLQNSSSLVPLLRACKTVRSLNQLHAHIILRGLDQHQFLAGQLISLFTELNPTNLSYPTTIFNSVINPNIYLYNIIIKSHCASQTSLSLIPCFSLLNRMMATDVVPDNYTFPPLIKLCANSFALTEGRVVHGLALRYGIGGDVYVGSSLVDMYGKCGVVYDARKVFDEIPNRNVVSWTAMMVGYLNVGDLVMARRVFDEMPDRNEAAWNAMAVGLVKFGDLSSARRLLDVMPYRSESMFTTLIDGYAKNGDMASARSLFDRLAKKDMFSWSALVSGYVQNGKAGEALNVFREMWNMHVKPDVFVMVSLMSACSQLGSLELAEWIDCYLVNNSFDLKSDHVVAARVDMHAKCGNVEKAAYLFESASNRDLISYCSMLQGLSIHGRGVEAVTLFNRMMSDGIKPDEVAFTIILSACARANLVEDGCRYFDLMVNKYSICASPDHYSCMVDLLGKSGKLRAAYELIRSHSIESHASSWGALLENCRLHCDIELGKEVTSKLFEIEPRSASSYVLLANIYAEAGRWLDVSRLRFKKYERGLQKVPGYTYVESKMPD